MFNLDTNIWYVGRSYFSMISPVPIMISFHIPIPDTSCQCLQVNKQRLAFVIYLYSQLSCSLILNHFYINPFSGAIANTQPNSGFDSGSNSSSHCWCCVFCEQGWACGSSGSIHVPELLHNKLYCNGYLWSNKELVYRWCDWYVFHIQHWPQSSS